MKKANTITLFLTFLLIGTVGVAQDNTLDNRDKLQFGLKGGLSYANVYNVKGDDFAADAKIGLTAGAFVTIPIGTYIGIHPEFMLTQKGFKGGGSLFGSEYSFKRTTTFFEIPLLFALKPSEFITILLGPQYSYLIHQRDVFSSTAFSYNQEQEFKRDNIRKNILGVSCGVDINLGHIVLAGRIGWDIQNNKGNGTSTTPMYKNVCNQFCIGYKFF